MKILLITSIISIISLNANANFNANPVLDCNTTREITKEELVKKDLKRFFLCERVTTICNYRDGLVAFEGTIDCDIDQELAKKGITKRL